MGYYIELNTLLRPPPDFDFTALRTGINYKVTLEKERILPLHIAILLIDKEWNFYGYAVAHSTSIIDGKTQIEFELLTKFSPDVQSLYKEKFIEAAKMTKEVK